MKTQKGITLIALIITIIVMLILVGVSVSTAINTGLFRTTSEVAQNTEGERQNESKIAQGIINIEGKDTDIGDYVKNLGNIHIGDLIEYTAGAKWKAIKVEGNKIEIIPNVLSEQEESFYYESEPDLDTLCQTIYGNKNNEYYTAEARSIMLNDISNITGYKSGGKPNEIYDIEAAVKGTTFEGWFGLGETYLLNSAFSYRDEANNAKYRYAMYVSAKGKVASAWFSESMAGSDSGAAVSGKLRPVVTLTLKEGVTLVKDKEAMKTETVNCWTYKK